MNKDLAKIIPSHNRPDAAGNKKESIKRVSTPKEKIKFNLLSSIIFPIGNLTSSHKDLLISFKIVSYLSKFIKVSSIFFLTIYYYY